MREGQRKTTQRRRQRRAIRNLQVEQVGNAILYEARRGALDGARALTRCSGSRGVYRGDAGAQVRWHGRCHEATDIDRAPPVRCRHRVAEKGNGNKWNDKRKVAGRAPAAGERDMGVRDITGTMTTTPTALLVGSGADRATTVEARAADDHGDRSEMHTEMGQTVLGACEQSRRTAENATGGSPIDTRQRWTQTCTRHEADALKRGRRATERRGADRCLCDGQQV